ncbi:hypothetical protein FNYG_07442 [Fusarium nygamai]|uniref:RlpA-like protein double-psi beta-barrel domain-containing protein n=1 Tax=Gibberella nygamai TaxID=42673 RepID=A0A2K0WAT0_GIBNY|nr:hypothetical protein FNYG_07442 [Fusarium nygamai]
MYFPKVSAALLGLAIGIQDVAAGPCKPESSHTLTERSLGATSSVFDAASTATSILSSTDTTQTRPRNEISSTVSLDSSSAEGTSTTTSDSESVSTTDSSLIIEVFESSTTVPSAIEVTASSTTEASGSTTDFSSTTEATTSFATTIETSESSTILPTTTEETPSTSTAPANEQPQIFTGGYATWVYQSGTIGDCGSVSQDTDFVVALDYRRYDRSKCGKKIRVTATSGRHIETTIDVTIVDVCFTCVNENSMDLSTAAFNAFGLLDDAVVNVKWQYLP